MMENGKIEDADGHSSDPDPRMVQALWAEFKAGLKGVVQEISSLQQSNIHLEDQVSECKRDTNEKILSLRNTVNTLQEDTSTAMIHISELSSRQKELQQALELMQTSQHRNYSQEEDLFDSRTFPCSQTQLSLIQHYISSMPTHLSLCGDPEKNASSSRTHSKTGAPWKERRGSRDLVEQNNQQLSQRQVAVLELLESERLYVSYLSLLLKANISFNGCENKPKDKRPFPSSLRFLIQQHLELLHLLQERALKNHWQGIMGDVFLRLTSGESTFLDNYVSYLKELPECISVLSLFSSNSKHPVGLLEGDITGDDTQPSRYTLLLQPIQRIPEYVGLLQSLLRQTESEHPDYYLLLLCMQHLRSFISQYGNLLQHNRDLLTQSHSHSLQDHARNLYPQQQEQLTNACKDQSRDPDYGLRRTKKAVRQYRDWDADSRRFHPDISFAFDSEARRKARLAPLQRIPETEGVGSALADAMETFLPYEGQDSHCSSPSLSTDSSIDIAFVPCSPSLTSDHQSHGRGHSRGDEAYRPNRGCVSPDSSSTVMPQSLQAVQRKSKSLNGLQMDNIDSHSHLVRSPAHPRLARQSSAKPKLKQSSPEEHLETPPHTVIDELTLKLHKDTTTPMWDELKWKGVSEKVDHTPLCEQNRKEGKGFRSSFKKLFKKKSSGESKVEKAEGEISRELEARWLNRADGISRGTAV